jgi:hypothetical protein
MEYIEESTKEVGVERNCPVYGQCSHVASIRAATACSAT